MEGKQNGRRVITLAGNNCVRVLDGFAWNAATFMEIFLIFNGVDLRQWLDIEGRFRGIAKVSEVSREFRGFVSEVRRGGSIKQECYWHRETFFTALTILREGN